MAKTVIWIVRKHPKTARTYSQDELDAAVAAERERWNALRNKLQADIDRPEDRSEQMQTYDEWRKAYNSMPLMNEAMAKAAWNAAIAVERERCARIVETQDTYGDNVGCWFETLAAKIKT